MVRSISDRGDLCVNIEYRIVFKYDNDIVLYESIWVYMFYLPEFHMQDLCTRYNGIRLYQMEVTSWYVVGCIDDIPMSDKG